PRVRPRVLVTVSLPDGQRQPVYAGARVVPRGRAAQLLGEVIERPPRVLKRVDGHGGVDQPGIPADRTEIRPRGWTDAEPGQPRLRVAQGVAEREQPVELFRLGNVP